MSLEKTSSWLTHYFAQPSPTSASGLLRTWGPLYQIVWMSAGVSCPNEWPLASLPEKYFRHIQLVGPRLPYIARHKQLAPRQLFAHLGNSLLDLCGPITFYRV